MERRSCVGMWRRDNARGAHECIEKQTERSDFWEESVRVQKLFLILDEHCPGRGDQGIARG
jgi:hypothetical protein